MYATLRPCEVKDVRYAACEVNDVRFTAFVLCNVVVRIWQSFGRYGLCTFGLRGPRGRAAFGDGYSCVLRDCVPHCFTVWLFDCATVCGRVTDCVVICVDHV